MKKRQIKATVTAVVVGVLAPLAMAVPASAATKSWDGHKSGSGDNYVSSGYNWEGDVTPDNGDTWYFPASGVSQVVDIDIAQGGSGSPIDVAGIYFNGTYSGTSEKVYSLAGDAIDLLGNIEATMTATFGAGSHSVGVDVNLKADSTFKTTGSNTLTIGGTATTLDLGAKTLTLDASGGTVTVQGKITGTGNITKAGTGKVLMLATPSAAGYTGTLTVPTGEVDANGTLGAINLTGGTLKGTGTVGALTMSSGTVAPGASPGVLTTGALAFTGGTHEEQLGGTAVGEFDQLNVTGEVDLGSATTLSISLTNAPTASTPFAPALKDSFIIVKNDGTDAVKGTFKGIKEGGKVIGDYTYQVSYKGGDGNDVTLTVTGTPAAPDTGVGSLVSSPVATLAAAILVAGAVAGYRFYEVKKARR